MFLHLKEQVVLQPLDLNISLTRVEHKKDTQKGYLKTEQISKKVFVDLDLDGVNDEDDFCPETEPVRL